jgi:uncharacterized protein (DUF1697 family)
MPTYIALFRGINVVGKNGLPMKELVEILTKLGCENVQTYIQSGNAVFDCKKRSMAVLAKSIGQLVEERRGFTPAVMLLTHEELEKAARGNPFPNSTSEPKSLHLGFLDSAPKKPNRKKLDELRADSESYQLKGQVFYLHAPDGIGRSKLAAGAERAIGVPMTMRNWRTVEKVMELGMGSLENAEDLKWAKKALKEKGSIP